MPHHITIMISSYMILTYIELTATHRCPDSKEISYVETQIKSEKGQDNHIYYTNNLKENQKDK